MPTHEPSRGHARRNGPEFTSPPTVLIGIVGYTPVLDPYPLGPRLMAALERRLARTPSIRIENMSWGPIHIVQRFQDPGAVRPDRLVLVGGASLCRTPGRVTAYRWLGGRLPEPTMQERIYEAVTGIVDIENTLAIGSHFGVWPQETFSVEIDLAAETFGRMVIADSEGRASDAQLTDELGFSPAAAIEDLVEVVVGLAERGPDAGIAFGEKSAAELAPMEGFLRNQVVG